MSEAETQIEVIKTQPFEEKRAEVFANACDKSISGRGSSDTILRNIFYNLDDSQKERMCLERDEKGNTALHCAAKAGNLEICQFLVAPDKDGKIVGADIVALGQNGMTPLQFAARYGCKENPKGVWSCMEWIIDKYAEKLKEQKEVWQMLQNVMPGRRNESELYDVCKKDKYGFSVLHHAIQNTNWAENTFVVKKLLDLKIAGTDKHYFKITDVDKQGNTSLHLAAQMDKMENHKIFDVFFEDLESKQHMKNNDILLHDGAKLNSVRNLIEYKSHLKHCIQAPNLYEKRPLHIACDVGNSESVEQLITSMKKLEVRDETMKQIINSPDSNGHVPLRLAIESGNVDLMKILLREGAQVSPETFRWAAR